MPQMLPSGCAPALYTKNMKVASLSVKFGEFKQHSDRKNFTSLRTQVTTEVLLIYHKSSFEFVNEMTLQFFVDAILFSKACCVVFTQTLGKA